MHITCARRRKENRNCSLQFEWNASYDTRDEEKYIGRYVCIGCNQAFVKYNDSLVIDDIPENNPSCCNDYTTKIFEERCECLPSRSSGVIPLANVPSPSSIWNSTLNASSPTPAPSSLASTPSPSSFTKHELKNGTAKVIFNGTYECDMYVVEDREMTKMNSTYYGFNETRHYSHYHFYQLKRGDPNITLPYQCRTCKHVKLKAKRKLYRSDNISKWKHNGTASIKAIRLWGYRVHFWTQF